MWKNPTSILKFLKNNLVLNLIEDKLKMEFSWKVWENLVIITKIIVKPSTNHQFLIYL